MSFFNGVISISNIYTLLLVTFGVLFLGYALGRVTIRGVSLGTAGVFVVALLCGGLLFNMNPNGELLFVASKEPYNFLNGLNLIEGMGLIFFTTSIGFIAGPKFIENFKINFKSCVLLGIVVVLVGGLSAVCCMFAGELFGYGPTIQNKEEFVAMMAGLFSGALSSTPAFSAAKATVAPELVGLVSVGYGITYIFGVIGIVLFVQLIPKLTKANIKEEAKKLVVKTKSEDKNSSNLIKLDGLSVAGFALAAALGVLIGQIKVPLTSEGLNGSCFSLTTTGGCLLASLILGHFGKIGKISILPSAKTLSLLRELGLVLFLTGAGISGGAEFVARFNPMYFIYGVFMTAMPIIVGYLFAKHVLKLSLINNLASLTGSMTSTPALGTLINTFGTEEVAIAYAATYPVALIAVVLVSQFLVIIF